MSATASAMPSTTTTAVPRALTTPFVPPPGCTDNFYTTIYTVQSSVITLLASGPLDSRFAACQPSGWDAGPTSFQFSPAVCPSGWGVYRLGPTTSGLENIDTRTRSYSESTFTTAYCCSSGFSLAGIPPGQFQGISSEACFQNRGTEDYGPSTGMRVHNPWHISWATTDLASLSPTPPTVPCPTNPSVVIPSWTPGATVDPSLSGNCHQNDGTDRWSESTSRGFEFLAYGLPVIGVFIIAAWVGWWCHRRSRRRREKLERALASQSAANANRGAAAAEDQEEEGILQSAGSGQPKEA